MSGKADIECGRYMYRALMRREQIEFIRAESKDPVCNLQEALPA